jgi:hypothetical protein
MDRYSNDRLGRLCRRLQLFQHRQQVLCGYISRNANTNSHIDPNPNSNGYGNCHSDGHSYSNCQRNCNRDSYAYTRYTHAYSDSDTKTYTDAEA